MKSLYERIKDAGIKTDSHESDLYFPATDETRQIIHAYQENGGSCSPELFRSEIDGEWWFDCPFMYSPWWEARAPKRDDLK